MTTSPIRPDLSPRSVAQESVATIEREVTLLLRRTLEEVWAQGYGAGTAVNRYSYPLLVRLEQSGPLRLGQLAELLGVSKPTVSRQVTRLVAAALVLVAEDPDDSRSGLVTLTRAGRAEVLAVRARRGGGRGGPAPPPRCARCSPGGTSATAHASPSCSPGSTAASTRGAPDPHPPGAMISTGAAGRSARVDPGEIS